MQLERIENKRKSQVAAEMLLQMIRGEKYPPGSKLPSEREISEAMSVSRNTLREAVAALETVGILEVRRSQGIFVAAPVAVQNSPDLGALNDLFADDMDPFAVIDARLAFEPGVAIMAAAEAADSEILQFGNIINNMRDALGANQQHDYRLADREFHMTIARLTKNPIIISTMDYLMSAISSPLWQAMKKWVPLANGVATSRLSEHLAIFSAIASRNEQEIARSVKEHLSCSRMRFFA